MGQKEYSILLREWKKKKYRYDKINNMIKRERYIKIISMLDLCCPIIIGLIYVVS